MDWSRGTGRTVSGGTDPEPNTGPDNDHTSGAGYYIYLEASEGVQGDNAILTSPPVDWTGADGSPKGCLTFWYNMNGWNTGSLELQLPNPGIEGTPATVLWSETGQQNNVWREARFVLVATKGLDWAGDIAVDDISLTQGDCSVQLECHRNGMLVAVSPYGYNPLRWASISPPTLSNCQLPTVPVFLSRWPQFQSRGWTGFAGGFFHRNDRCAGNAIITETATSISYSRDLNIFYGNDGRHFTDTFVRVTCIIPKATPTPSDPPVLPPPRVVYNLVNQWWQRIRGPVQRGTTMGLVFRLQTMQNSAGVTDIKVEQCVITNGQTQIPIVQNSCPRLPIGVRLTKPSQGISVLWLSTVYFPPGSLDWNFRCRIRTCTPTDTRCRTPVTCESRRKRSAMTWTQDRNTVIISSDLTLAR
ncbi:hypothetical protein BaRGS_00039406 [Batillaria attramentaria]|uniref:MAM domain-containing protein n=1 Tax=Batillaria attramentaria TaxID=370345 RepID=A0ABD0J326_9CAEN